MKYDFAGGVKIFYFVSGYNDKCFGCYVDEMIVDGLVLAAFDTFYYNMLFNCATKGFFTFRFAEVVGVERFYVERPC